MGKLDDLENQPFGALGMSATAIGFFLFSTDYIFPTIFTG